MTCLHLAIELRKSDIIPLLLQRGACTDVVDKVSKHVLITLLLLFSFALLILRVVSSSLVYCYRVSLSFDTVRFVCAYVLTIRFVL
jgi:hypothetical protein